GGKYHPTLHKCPKRSMRVLILGEGETLNEDGDIVATECKLIGVLGKMGEYHTMKIEGKLANVNMRS
ncbi:pentatricopeptide repeat-containing protein, partial [Trifolium pratense]